MRGKKLATAAPVTGKGSRHLLPESLRSMQELLELLPNMAVNGQGEIDYAATHPDTLSAVAEHAASVASAINLGMSAVGTLMAYAAPECEDGTVSSDAIEAVGWLFAELGAATAVCIQLTSRCKTINRT